MIKKLLFICMMLLVLPGANAGILQDIQNSIKTLAITSYASNVPVTIDYQNQQNYWILSANIGSRTDELRIVLPEATQLTLDQNTAIKTGQAVTLTLRPTQPYSATTLLKGGDIRYLSYRGVFGIGDVFTPAPYYDVSGGTWLTKSTYSIALSESAQGGTQASQNVEVSYLDRQQIYIKDGRGYQATIENIGSLGNGISPPGGSLVVVSDPQGIKHLWEKNSFQTVVQRATDYVYSNGWAGSYSWAQYWEIMKTQGLPSEYPVSGQVSYPSSTGIKITYPTGSFSAQVVMYVPSDMANSITINPHASKPEIIEKSLTSVTEGQAALLTVKVKNVGTDDYIKVAPTSNYYTFSPLSDSRQYLKSGDIGTFTWRAIGIDVPNDLDTVVNILAEGSAGYATTTATAKIYDQAAVVYCDPVRQIVTGCGDKTTWKLQVTAFLPDGNTVYSSGPIYVNGELKANGVWSADVPKGDYIITGLNTSGYFAPTPLKVTIIDQDRSVQLVYSKDPKSQDTPIDWGNFFWLMILLGVIAVIWYMKLWTYALPLLKFAANPITLLSSPTIAIVAVIVLLGILILLWKIYALLSGVGGDILRLIGG